MLGCWPHKNLVIARAGDSSPPPEWLRGYVGRTWDIVAPMAATHIFFDDREADTLMAKFQTAPRASVTPTIGDDNTLVNVPQRSGVMGSRNTIVHTTDPNGNTIINRGGTAIGARAYADSTSVAIGAGANAGATPPPAVEVPTASFGDALIIKPTIGGVGIDLTKAWKWMRDRWRSARR